MNFLPKSTNGEYSGSAVAPWYLALVGLNTIAPGCIHFFLPDGGAGVIAHLDLSTRRDTILALFAWEGATQIPTGIGELIVAVRYRSLTPLFLSLAILERALMAYDGWLGRGSHGDHHPPEHYASLLAVPLGLSFLALSLRKRKGANPAPITQPAPMPR